MQLASAPTSDRLGVVTDQVRTIVAAVLRCAVDRLDLESALSTAGLDSLLAAEVRNRIQLGLGVRVPMLAILRGTTAGLARQALETMGAAAPARPGAVRNAAEDRS
jgi:hypothetical protein